MSGPDYPNAPAVDTVTGAKVFDFWDSVISQFANSPIITTLISQWFSSIDQTGNLKTFHDNVWDLNSAFGYGLDVWGRIVGLKNGRTVVVVDSEPFGFAESGTAVGFGQGPFGLASTSIVELNDPQFLRLIFAKARSNISNGSIQSLNQILNTLYGDEGTVYVTDGSTRGPYFGFIEPGTAVGFGMGPFWSDSPSESMTMAVVFTFPPSPLDLAILNAAEVFPRPGGVALSIQTP